MVTYFSIEWMNSKTHKNDSSILIVDGSKKRITYAELTIRGDVLLQQDGPLQASSGARFFTFLTDVLSQWGGQTDFSVPASEDNWWKIKIRVRPGKTYRIKGTVAYPPCGTMIEKELWTLCEEAGIRVTRVQ